MILEYRVGAYAYLDRLAAWQIGCSILRALGVRNGYRAPWDKLGWDDPDRPALICSVSELEPLD